MQGVGDGLVTSVFVLPLIEFRKRTVPSRFPIVGPASEMKMSAPHAAAF